jgi:hypothetical protein
LSVNGYMKHSSDVTIADTALYFIPLRCRQPLAFGRGTVESVVCARASVTVVSPTGRYATGWGEAPLNGSWAWPDGGADREEVMTEFCRELARRLRGFPHSGHPVEISIRFMDGFEGWAGVDGVDGVELPLLAAQLCYTPYDLALHDAYGQLHGTGVFETLTEEWMNGDLAYYFGGVSGSEAEELFRGRYPGSYLVGKPAARLQAWHLVGYLDALEESPAGGTAEAKPAAGGPAAGPAVPGPVVARPAATGWAGPETDVPRSLPEWISRDGLELLKIKLRGCDLEADLARLEGVMAAIGLDHVAAPATPATTAIKGLSLDLNGTPDDAGYLHNILDTMERRMPRAFRLLMYVEEPLAPTRGRDKLAVESLARRKPLFMDESAVRWQDLLWGREAGWTGVALKTAKTLTGSLLSNCWAGEFGMPVMVQDLTNPMLAQLSHLALASRVQTICGVESNSMQFYPAASDPEAAIHPGAYRRVRGTLDISTLRGPGFGYRLEEMKRELPERAA